MAVTGAEELKAEELKFNKEINSTNLKFNL